MGRTHALTGWCAGLGLAALLDRTQLGEVVLLAATVAGYALLPDLDHPGASASRLLGPLTRALSWVLRNASAALYAVTKGPRDEDGRGTHRHLTHTVLFAVGLGLAAGFGSAAGGRWVTLGIVVFGLLLAEAALGDLLLPVVVAGALWLVLGTGGSAVADALSGISGWIGVAVGTGCVVHCLGDALTRSGCPMLFPVPIAGETWYEIRPPRALRFRTGGPFESWVVVPVCLVAAVALLPGVPELARTTYGRLVDAPAVAATR